MVLAAGCGGPSSSSTYFVFVSFWVCGWFVTQHNCDNNTLIQSQIKQEDFQRFESLIIMCYLFSMKEKLYTTGDILENIKFFTLSPCCNPLSLCHSCMGFHSSIPLFLNKNKRESRSPWKTCAQADFPHALNRCMPNFVDSYFKQAVDKLAEI